MDSDRKYSEEELAYWLGLHALVSPSFKSSMARKLVEAFDGIGAWKAGKYEIIGRNPEGLTAIADAFIERRNKIDPEKLLQQLRATDIEAIPIWDQRYPYLLRECEDAPMVLFVRGELKDNDFRHGVAVVGTRRPTNYGMKNAKDLARGLAQNGAVVTSGLALGIDSLAHWGAIEGGGRTVAVLAHGADLCYPSSNKRLYNQILEGCGVCVSAFFPGTPPDKWQFPARNRIIAGMTKGTVVVEAGESSGALITADFAFRDDRTVMAMPGSVDNPMTEGIMKLFRADKAKAVRNFSDVLDDLNWVKTTHRNVPTVVELFGREKELYTMLSFEPVHFDSLCEQTQMGAGELSATLTMLELAGLVTRHAGDWYSKANVGADLPPNFMPQST
jgi:DNA processing protein